MKRKYIKINTGDKNNNKNSYKSLNKQSDLIHFPYLRNSQKLLKRRQKEKLLSEKEQINYFIKTASSPNSYINNIKKQWKKYV